MTEFGYRRVRVPSFYIFRAELNRSFGWEAKENAIGVYYAGHKSAGAASWIYEDSPDGVKRLCNCCPMAMNLPT